MSLQRKDKEFRTPKTTYVDFKHIEMDRVLTMLFPRLKYEGFPSRFNRSRLLTTETFVEEFVSEQNAEWFEGFSQHEDVVRKWVETDLLDLVNRGRPTQAVAAPRPLHGNTYKFRNVKYTRDYNVAEQIYWMLYHSAKGQAVRDQLKAFFFKGYDAHTDKYDENMNVDVETQAILRLDNQVHSDSPATKTPERHPPLCQGQVDLMAEDILRILAYEERIPRSVLVDYLKTILSFHLALYHMKLLFLLPRMVKRKAVDQECASGGCSVAGGSSQTACPCALGLVVDLNDANNPRMSELARESADRVYQQIPSFVQANFVVKKLDEMAEYLALQGKITPPASGSVPVSDLLKLLKDDHRSDREKYFFSRMEKALGDLRGDDDALDPEIQEIAKSGLSDMDKFIETLMSVRGKYHHKYIVQCLDALMQKNKEAGMLLQTRAKGSPRRFTLSSKLLEAILQIAVLEPTESGFRTKEIRVEELLGRLRNRYGLYIDRLPPGAEEMCGMEEREALRGNLEVFKRRLREIGFFEDLSDAYVTQKIRPRYVMTGEEA